MEYYNVMLYHYIQSTVHAIAADKAGGYHEPKSPGRIKAVGLMASKP